MKNLPFLLVLVLFITNTNAQNLPRRGSLGTQLVAVNDSMAQVNLLFPPAGVAVHYVVEGGAGHGMGILAGDIILSINEEPAQDVNWLVRKIGRYQEGDSIKLSIMRNGEMLTLSGTLKGFPEETSPFANVLYDAVPFEDGLLRTIIHIPEASGKRPAIFFIQGYDCSSIDNLHPASAYNRLLQGFSEKGYVVIKTEKPNAGDSRNPCGCSEIDFFTEVAAFSASYNALAKYDFIDLENVFIIGYSMGGYQAPMLTTEFDPRGIAVFGTVVRPWFEYLIEITRWQRLLTGQDYLQNEANHLNTIKFFYRFMIEKQPPEVLQTDPEMAAFLKSFWGYTDEEKLLNGRHYTFWHQVQDVRLFEAWSKTPAHVLSLWGEGDFVALNPKEHELIADIVNRYNPGKAHFVVVPNTDHSLNFVRDQKHSAEVWGNWAYSAQNFNPTIIEVICAWMSEVMEN